MHNYKLHYAPSVGGEVRQSIMFIHGLWSNDNVWESWQQSFSLQGYQSWCINMRIPGANLTIHDYVAMVNDALERIQSTHGIVPILIGHSLGGLVAQLIATERPVPAMVLIASAVPAGISNINWSLLSDFWRYLPHLFVHGYKRRLSKQAKNYLDYFRFLADISRRLPKTIRKKLALDEHFPSDIEKILREEGLLREPPPRISRIIRTLALGRVRIPQIQCQRILIVAGRQDRVVSLRAQRALAAKYAFHSTLIEHDFGHMPMLEDGTESVIEQIFLWLNTNF